MFTEGLDSNALKWVREESDSKKREMPLSFSTQKLLPRNGGRGRGIGLPSPDKFRSGHLPLGVMPVSRAIPLTGDHDTESGSDMDITSDDEDNYGSRYSLDSSPPDSRIPTASVRRRDDDTSTYNYSDFSTSTETVQLKKGSVVDGLGRDARRDSAGLSGYVEDESSDSAASSEISSSKFTSSKSSIPQKELHTTDSHTSSVRSFANTEVGRVNVKLTEEDFPSAPPFDGAEPSINQVAEQGSTSHISYSVTPNDFATRDPDKMEGFPSVSVAQDAFATEGAQSSGSFPVRLPTFHASGQGPWCAVIAYDACVRLCLHAWARGCMEAPIFLDNECALLRKAFGLQQVLLQSEEELMGNQSSELVTESAAPKPKKVTGKMKVQVRKVKMAVDPPTSCSFCSMSPPTLKLEFLRLHLSNLRSSVSSGWKALRRVRASPQIPANGSFSRQSLAYVHAGTQYIKEVCGLLRVGVTSLRSSSSSYEAVQENYSCLLRLKSSSEEDAVKMQPGSSETHLFFPDSPGDDLIIEVQDSKGKCFGRALAQVAAVADDPGDKLRWWSIYHEPEHELVGRLQLYINYSTCPDEYNQLKCGPVAETVAYDLAMEVAMKVQHFQERNLWLKDPWKWLLSEFATFYGVSEAYTKLRYLSYVMDVATPTADCLTLVHDLIVPVIMKGNCKTTLSHQENRILGETVDQIKQILALVFENYKSLDESARSGMTEIFMPATGLAALALAPAVKLYMVLYDVLTSEAQLNLCRYFQTAAKKRARRHLAETDEFVSGNESTLMDPVTQSLSYQKMKSLCLNVKNEISTDIEIHNQHVLPSFVDLPNLSASIYSAELCSRLRSFLVACPPTGPSPPVVELVIATADFQKDLAHWNINPVKGGVDAKELFHLYIVLWIQDKRLALLDSCKLDKVKWSGVRTPHSTTPFVDEMYERLKETLNQYEPIIRRWPEYVFVLENAIADVEKAIVEALDKQYADVIAPLKDNLAPKKFGLKYVQKLTKRTECTYTVPDELGVLLNSMKRMLDVLRPKIETQLKSWAMCLPNGGNAVPGERLSEVTVMLRAKFRNYLQAVVEKLAENTRLQNSTKLKKIIQDSKEVVIESDVRNRMQPLKDLLTKTINQLSTAFETQLFIVICRGYWDRLGQDVLRFLEERKENRSWYKGSRVAVSVLDDAFASQMQQLLGNALQEKDLEPPRSIMEVRSMLCKDVQNQSNNNYFY